jgi:hypothetical protein
MLDKLILVRVTDANAPAFISWMSSAREAGEKQPLEAFWAGKRISSRSCGRQPYTREQSSREQQRDAGAGV